MVNYCCVSGCGQHSRKNKLLKFFCLPKEAERQAIWLKAASREDLLQKSPELLMKHYRVCSRHFTPMSIKNKRLCGDATPTLHLPGNLNEDESENEPTAHENVVCDSCHNYIFGFRYKCIICPDYDLCPKCEMLQVHSEHYFIRIPMKMKFKLADDLAQKWKKVIRDDNPMTDTSVIVGNDSSDDEPITKYVKNYDTGIDLTEEVKNKIRDEVTRILNIPMNPPNETENKIKKKKLVKRRVAPGTDNKERESQITNKKQKIEDDASVVPEVAFADVNEPSNQVIDIKIEIPDGYPSAPVEPAQPMMHMKVSDDLSELMIEMNDQKTVYKF